MTLAALAVAAVLAPAAPHPPAPAPPAPIAYGTIAVCSVAGSRPVAGTLTYTLAAPASAGGTQTTTVAVGACSTPAFYPTGTALSIVENVPAGDAVTSIAFSGLGTLAASSPTAGSATVTIGTGAGVLSFTTNGPATSGVSVDCRVPNVLGLGVVAARASIVKHSCTVGLIRRKYSSAFRAGHVMSESPRRGTVLAHAAPIDVIVSRGPHA